MLTELAEDPGARAVVMVKRRTQLRINGIATYISVNPRIAGWRMFLADVYQELENPGITDHQDAPRVRTAARTVLADAKKEFENSDKTSQQHLRRNVVGKINKMLDRAVNDAYFAGRTTVAAAMANAAYGTKKQQQTALADLNGVFKKSWKQFAQRIKVQYPPEGTR